MLAQLGEVPAAAAEDADDGIVLVDGVALAGDGLDEGGFAAAVRAEDRNMLPGIHRQIDVMQDDIIATSYIYVCKF